MKKLSDVLQVYTDKKKLVANIVLNGYNIEQGGPIGRHGAMRSFIILDGDLWDEWSSQKMLTIRSGNGNESNIRVAALPVDDESYGLIEFL
ncbi:MAG: hypothetical protein KC443_11750 [Anaerolineales bacterium]|nr:hypothetical protein [Anaerolineales bacterium]